MHESRLFVLHSIHVRRHLLAPVEFREIPVGYARIKDHPAPPAPRGGAEKVNLQISVKQVHVEASKAAISFFPK